jgi:pimeloyl-ACP methyl ester carboxylesterase
MGHSMGGVVVQRYLASAAAPTVERAVLVDTFFRGGPAPAEEARLTDVERGGMAAIWRPNPTLAALLPDVAEFVEKRFLATSAEAFVALGRELIALPDTRPSLAAIDLPVLVVCGAGDDRFPPAVSRSLAAAIPGCEYAEIPAAGHTPHVENVPAFLAAVLPFLVRR